MRKVPSPIDDVEPCSGRMAQPYKTRALMRMKPVIKLILLTMMVGLTAIERPALAAQSPAEASRPGGQGQPASPAPATPDHIKLRCADYRRQQDGAWTPRRPIIVGGVSLTPGVSFTSGVSFSGIDLAARLDARCSRTLGK